MKKKTKKSIISLVLSFLLILTTFTPALAAESIKPFFNAATKQEMTADEVIQGIKDNKFTIDDIYKIVSDGKYVKITDLSAAKKNAIKEYLKKNNMEVDTLIEKISNGDMDVITAVASEIDAKQAECPSKTKDELTVNTKEIEEAIKALPEASEVTSDNLEAVKAQLKSIEDMITALLDADPDFDATTIPGYEKYIEVGKKVVALPDYEELKAGVEAKVAAYEKLANGDLTTQELINAAKAAKAEIVLDGLNDADKAAFQTRIDAADKKVADAQKVIDNAKTYAELKAGVETKVAAYEKLANGDLTTQELINAAKAAKAEIVLDRLNDADKAAFQTRIDAADAKVADAQKVMDEKTALNAVKNATEENIIEALQNLSVLNKDLDVNTVISFNAAAYVAAIANNETDTAAKIQAVVISVNETEAPKLADASLAGIKVGGKAIDGFATETKYYNVVLPYNVEIGESTKVVAEPTQSRAKVTILPPTISSLPTAVTIQVDSIDGTKTEYYTLNLSKAAAKADKAVTTFGLGVENEKVEIKEEAGTINVTVPYKTDIKALIATFTFTGKEVKVGEAVQESGVTANDFTKPVTYTVVAEDGSTKNYTVTVTVTPASTESKITSFKIGNVEAKIDHINAKITAVLPTGTDITKLTPVIEVSEFATVSPASGEVKDFTHEVLYTVTAQDGSKSVYEVAITAAPQSSVKEIKTFSIEGVKGEIAGTNITVTLPYDKNRDVKKLVATFTFTGKEVKVGEVVQVSGTTENDFTSGTLTYTVVSEDNTRQTYAVKVNITPVATDSIIHSFSFKGIASEKIDIKDGSIAITVPFGTDVTKLIAEFEVDKFAAVTADTAAGDDIKQVSGTTENNFTLPITYRVTAQNGDKKVYVVTVTIGDEPTKATGKAINEFNIGEVKGTITTSEKTGKVDSPYTVAVELPYGTSKANQIAVFTASDKAKVYVVQVKEGAEVKDSAVLQESGKTVNDFTNPVYYKVVAEDGTPAYYKVTVTNKVASSEKIITSFKFEGLGYPAIGSIEGTNITVKVATGQDLTKLVPTIEVSKFATITPNSGLARDFSTPRTYTVIAQDGTQQVYTVRVDVQAKAFISSFSIKVGDKTYTGNITEEAGKGTINVNVPKETVKTALVATFTASEGATVKVSEKDQTSGTTENDFTNSVVYTVTNDKITREYTVTVSSDSSSENNIKIFKIGEAAGTIDGTNITVKVSANTDLTKLAATFTASDGAIVKVGEIAQESGKTENDFTNPVVYTVISAFGTTKNYTVTVVKKSTENTMNSFKLFAGTDKEVVGTINQEAKTVTLVVPMGTDLTNLKPTIEISKSATVSPASLAEQTFNSGVAVDYTVESENGEKNVYAVTVNRPNGISLFTIGDNVADPITENGLNEVGAITVSVPYNVDRSALVATFTKAPNTTVEVITTDKEGKEIKTPQVSGVTENNFTEPVKYRVTHTNGNTKEYVVTVTQAESHEKEMLKFSVIIDGKEVPMNIDKTNITLTVPYGTNVTNLVAVFEASKDATVKVGESVQESGKTVNNFTSPVTYTVVAKNGDKQDYTVTITVKGIEGTLKFTESSANDGSVSGQKNVVLTGDKFNSTVEVGAFLVEGVHYEIVGKLPVGLTLKVAKVNDNTVRVWFTGNAMFHMSADSISKDLGIKFLDAAFDSSTTAEVMGENTIGITINFVD